MAKGNQTEELREARSKAVENKAIVREADDVQEMYSSQTKAEEYR